MRSATAGAVRRGHSLAVVATLGMCAALLVAVAAAGTARAAVGGGWWNAQWGFRVPVTVGAAGVARQNRPVELDVAFGNLLASNGVGGAFDPATVRVLEVDGSGNPVGDPVPVQVDAAPGGSGSARVIFLMGGTTAAEATRTFHVYFDRVGSGIPAQAVTPLVSLADSGVSDAGQDAYRIDTQIGSWYLQKRGASFSSLVDRDFRDWIGFDPTTGSGAGGEFRGIPNFPFPEGFFHPGFSRSSTTVIGRGPLKVTIDSNSDDGQWAYRNEIYPTYVTSTVLRADAAHGYWWLYEGTPGGQLDTANQIVVRPGFNGPTQTSAADSWTDELAGEEWVYFGVPSLGASGGRSLYFSHHEDDGAADSYYPMSGPSGSMTVFGFGRNGSQMLLNQINQHFTMGLVDSTSPSVAVPALRSASHDVVVGVGALTKRESVTSGSTSTSTSGTTPTSSTTTSTTRPGGTGTTGEPATLATLVPARLLDTRTDGPPVGASQPRVLQVRGQGGVSQLATTAVLNVTVDRPAADTVLTVWPSGTARPTASNLNVAAGQTAANLVTAPLGADGAVNLAVNTGTANVVVDVVAAYVSGGSALAVASASPGAYHPLTPHRVLDTRESGGPIGPGQARVLSLPPAIGVVSANLSAIALNVTATNPSTGGYLTVYPADVTRPPSSNLNFGAGETAANAVVAKTSADGSVAIFNAAGSTDVVVDVVGFYDYGGLPDGLTFHSLASPTRILDTRTSASPLGTAASRGLVVAGGPGGIPAGAQGVVVNLTGTEPSAPTFVTLYPGSASLPLASSLNLRTGATRANHAMVRLGDGGDLGMYNASGQVHLVIDAVGWFG